MYCSTLRVSSPPLSLSLSLVAERSNLSEAVFSFSISFSSLFIIASPRTNNFPPPRNKNSLSPPLSLGLFERFCEGGVGVLLPLKMGLIMG